MINKIIHFSDLHLRLFKEHTRYRTILTEAMNEWKVESPDRIVFTGDLVHSKNQMTPELLEIVSWTLTECAKICKTIILIGNHDFIEQLTRFACSRVCPQAQLQWYYSAPHVHKPVSVRARRRSARHNP